MTESEQPDTGGQQEQAAPEKNPRGKLVLVGKLLLTAGMLALVFARIDFAEMAGRIKNISPLHLLLSFLALNVAQLLSALRMRYYFATAGWQFDRRFTIALYYVGALFNVMLPGGISGDGYKAWFLKRHLNVPLGLAIRRMISERANGLCFLLMIAILLLLLSPAHAALPGGKPLLLLAIPTLVACYLASIHVLLREKPRTALGASRFSAVSQGLIALSALSLFLGMGADHALLGEYLALFMVSCVLSILPVSVGGAGIREMTFLYGGGLLNLDVELGIATSLAFFAVHVTTSLLGFFFLKRVRPLAARQRFAEGTAA